MGRKKYYCDFCDVLFPDNQEARKKHNSGLAHHRMKEAHYRLFFGKRQSDLYGNQTIQT